MVRSASAAVAPSCRWCTESTRFDSTKVVVLAEIVAPARKLTEPEQAARQHTRSEPLIVTKKENSAPTLTTS